MTGRWPDHPYKGLSYYGPDDVLLFAGRKHDVERIAPQLARSSVRILIMHGRTGCGKSSFLRAGLIPFLERPEHGYQFLSSVDDARPGTSAIFIKSGDNPLARLAEELFNWGGRRLEIETPVGSATIDLSSIRLQHEKLDEFVDDAGTSGKRMVKCLAELARLLPRTLIIVIDQAEEVVTLRADSSGDQDRSQFFDFLASFATSRMDLKLLIALRSEYYAEFDSEIRRRQWNTDNIRQEQLLVLDESAIALAIEHPTQHEGYGFEYEKGLPARIARDLVKTVPKGGALPVLQIICTRLYDTAKERSPEAVATIATSDYESLGGVEEQVDSYLQEVLSELCGERLSKTLAEAEIDKWYQVLSLLVRQQVDGTSTKNEMTVEDLQQRCAELRCAVPFHEAMDFLSKQRIVQETQVRNIQTDELHTCYTLGHDAIGLALRVWSHRGEGRDQVLRRTQKRFRDMGLVALAYTVVFLALDLFTEWGAWVKFLWGVFGIYGIGFMFLGYGPDRFLRRFRNLGRSPL